MAPLPLLAACWSTVRLAPGGWLRPPGYICCITKS
jgi:hypothetical protein